MPFIRGRYHINPIMGEALEAAREAEAAMREHQAHSSSDDAEDQADGFADLHSREHANEQDAKGPIHRIEIEAAELVPSHSGRAARGYVARIHRHPPGPAPDAAAAQHSVASSRSSNGAGHPSPPETHVFSDHRDLVNFLHHELAQR